MEKLKHYPNYPEENKPRREITRRQFIKRFLISMAAGLAILEIAHRHLDQKRKKEKALNILKRTIESFKDNVLTEIERHRKIVEEINKKIDKIANAIKLKQDLDIEECLEFIEDSLDTLYFFEEQWDIVNKKIKKLIDDMNKSKLKNESIVIMMEMELQKIRTEIYKLKKIDIELIGKLLILKNHFLKKLPPKFNLA